MTSGSTALYQVAVALVPALLFGGAVLELRGQRGGRRRKLVGFGVAAILAAGVVAEIIAIRGAIDPGVEDLERRYLVPVLTAGTAGLAIWIAAPLLRDATVGWRRRSWPIAVAAILLTALVGQVAITESLDHASARIALEEASKLAERRGRELGAAQRAESNARTQVLVLVRSLGSPEPVVAAVTSALRSLDDGRLDPLPDGEPSVPEVQSRMTSATARLNRISLDLERDFERRIPGLSEAERELLVQAKRA